MFIDSKLFTACKKKFEKLFVNKISGLKELLDSNNLYKCS